MESKLLDLNLDKSSFMVVGERKQRKHLEDDLKKTPLTLYGKPLRQKEKEIYLGDTISTGNAESVEATVQSRYSRIMSSIMETRTVIEDARLTVAGAVVTGIEIYEVGIVPSLLENCETWVEIKQKTLDTLDKLQSTMYRVILSCPKSTPNGAMLADLGGKLMKYRIQERKLNFIHHLLNLPDGSLACKILNTQLQLNLPGLGSEVRQYIYELKLHSLAQLRNISKAMLKQMVKLAIDRENCKEISNLIKGSKKLAASDILTEPIGRKSYFQNLILSESRTLLNYQSFMTRYVRWNYKNDKNNQKVLRVSGH